MRLNSFASLAIAALSFPVLLTEVAVAQSPAQTTPDSSIKNEPAVATEKPSLRLAKQIFLPGKRSDYEAMVATHAKANDVPESLVHRIIVRESKYQPHLVSRGNIGLMQIKLATARGVGYTGTAEGLRDANTNMTYGVKYLAGAWRTAAGDANQAVSYYARGYYYAAKAKGLHKRPAPGEALQVVSIKERSRDRKKNASISYAAPRLDELVDAIAPVGAKQ